MFSDIDQLLYYPYYCIAAVIATLILIIMYFIKRNYPTKRNKLFLTLIIYNLAASAVNILSIFTISFPEKYPAWFRYGCNMVYLFLYNTIAVMFLLYVNNLVNISKLRKPVYIFATSVWFFEAFVIFSSPWTHFVSYYDDDLIYRHGPLMVSLYACAFVLVMSSIGLYLLVHKKFNFYQTFSITGFVAGIILCVMFQAYNPRIVITNFICAMALFFLYSAFENPAYYLYGDTSCFNRHAFVVEVNRLRKKKEYSVIYVKASESEDIIYSLRREGREKLAERMAERISGEFGREAFCIDVGVLTVVVEHPFNMDRYLNRIRKCFDEPYAINTDVDYNLISVKPVIAVIPVKGEPADGQEMLELIRNAEEEFNQELTYINDTGRRVAAIRREKELLHVLDNAIINHGFEVYYQPILEAESNRFVCAEALIRLNDEKLGFVSPEEFIPIAEKNGRIGDIGEYVFREVCRFVKESNITSLGVKFIEINLSPVQCKKKGLALTLINILREYDVDPQYINLEITETAEVENNILDRLNELMNNLHEKGIKFALDDFGSGFAALDYLIKLPADVVKIDKGILWHAFQEEASMIILRNTIKMVRDIGKKIVVEGVENDEMADVLKECNCDYLQGYLYSKPLPESEYVQFMEYYGDK